MSTLIEKKNLLLQFTRKTTRNFAMVGAIFAGVECVIEKYRAKHDVINPVLGGCITGVGESFVRLMITTYWFFSFRESWRQDKDRGPCALAVLGK